jgi:DNA-binding SARP family transcriptional activator/tetratricopeptide (TPR) repeat protein
MTVQFGVLGDVEARANGQLMDLGPARQRCVLAALVVDANQPVGVDQLADRIWGQLPPQRAQETLYSYLSRLRGVLANSDGVSLTRRPGGYVLEIDPDAVDLHRFRRLAASARAITTEDGSVSLLGEALRLWRGTAFGALDTPWVNGVRQVLDSERAAAEADLTDLRLRRGEHAGLSGDLASQARDRPLDERVAAQLILALYLGGRTGDALAHYRRIRADLAAELGIDPGPKLQRLHQQILQADPELTCSSADAPGQSTSAVRPSVPRELPADICSFAGRRDELSRLDRVVSAGGRGALVVAVSGTAGVGKTTLALHWAHRVAQQFPDGQLYVNLRGFDGAAALGAAVALRRFIATLGVPAAQIPSGIDARAALFRSLLADKRVLVVIDNARDAEHAQPLLPGAAGSMAIVTSRTTLVGLAAAAGAHHLALDVLSAEDARALLAARIGSAVVAAQPDAVDEAITRCARLPLALAIASARMPAGPARLVAELRAADDALDAFHLPETTVATVLSWSYRILSEQAARLFRFVACHPGADLAAPAAASLAGLEMSEARQRLRELVDANLLTELYPGRYTCHDLLRAYAAQQARVTDSEADRDAALERVLNYYAHTAHVADRLVYPARPPIVLLDPPKFVVSPELADASAAWAWLAAERDNVIAALNTAVGRRWRLVAWRLAWGLSTLHQRKGHPQDLYRSWRSALAVLHDDDPVPMRAIALREIAEACARMGHFAEAFRCLHEASSLVDGDDWLIEKAAVLRTLARTHGRQGDDRTAYEYASRALAIYRRLEHRDMIGSAANAVGWYAARIGEYEVAASHLRLALTTARAVGNRLVESHALHSTGFLAQHMGDHERAIPLLQQCVDLARANGDAHNEATALRDLGTSLAALGQHESAVENWRRALPLLECQDRRSEADRVRAAMAAAVAPEQFAPSVSAPAQACSREP